MVDVVLTALPLGAIASTTVLAAVGIARSLRDETVLDALRAEIRSVGEVHRAVVEVRSSRTAPSAPR